MEQCQVFSGNDVLSCFPNTTTSVPQHDFASFVWNSRLPEFTQTNLVNIYLLSATENTLLLQWNNIENPTNNAGLIHAQVNDTWWGSRGNEWDGTNLPFLFQWAITRADQTLDASVPRQPTFTGLQTTFADSIIASMSSTSAAAASSSSAAAASRSSASAASASAASASLSQGGGLGSPTSGASGTGAHPTGTSTSAAGGPGSGNVQSSSSSPFPHWAIAVIVVLGFLALLAGGILTFFIMRRIRQRRGGADLSHRGSMGSSTPMMRNADTGGEPVSPVGGSAPAAYGAISHRPPSPEVHDGASTMSRVSDAALFSGADAAVMADAFRAALRKPNFATRPVEEGESPEMELNNDDGVVAEASGLLDRELAEEGRDIRSVGSSRGVKVETLSDAADDTDEHRP